MAARAGRDWGGVPGAVLLSGRPKYSWRVEAGKPGSGGSVSPLVVGYEGIERVLTPGPAYRIGRDPKGDIPITDDRVSWHHAELRVEGSRWVLVDVGSTNGTYVADQRMDRVEIIGIFLARLGDPSDGTLLTCVVTGPEPGAAPGGRPATQVADLGGSALGRNLGPATIGPGIPSGPDTVGPGGAPASPTAAPGSPAADPGGTAVVHPVPAPPADPGAESPTGWPPIVPPSPARPARDATMAAGPIPEPPASPPPARPAREATMAAGWVAPEPSAPSPVPPPPAAAPGPPPAAPASAEPGAPAPPPAAQLPDPAQGPPSPAGPGSAARPAAGLLPPGPAQPAAPAPGAVPPEAAQPGPQVLPPGAATMGPAASPAAPLTLGPAPVPPPPAPGAAPEPAVPEVVRIGRAPESDIVIPDTSASRNHAELHRDGAGLRIVDLGSSNGTYVNGQRVKETRLSEGDIVGIGSSVFRLAGQHLLKIHDAAAAVEATSAAAAASVHREDGAPPAPSPAEPAGPAPAPPAAAPAPPVPPVPGAPGPAAAGVPAAAPAGAGQPGPWAVPPKANADGTLEIGYAIRWLVPRGERFANFAILNDNDSQLEYYRKFGHIYAVGVPTKKWRLVVVSDPDLLDEVAGNEEQFGKRAEEINFFAQLSNSRRGGISVIGDSARTEMIRRVMLPWYSPQHQRTQLELMKEQARRLVANWAALPDEQPVDARVWMERYALEVSGRGACNYNFGLLDGNPSPPPFAEAVLESTKESIRRVADPFPDSRLTGRASRARRDRYRQYNAELVRTTDALVRARKYTTPLGRQNDLLSRLVSTPDPETGEYLDRETVRDQMLMHLSNGFNGPSITGAWLAYVLASYPEVEEKVLAEIDGITGGDPDYDLKYDDLMSLTYITQVIKETLRVYPPQPVTIRRSLRDGTLGRYRVRKGDIILVGSLAAQRDPRYWGPEPDAFDPSRFEADKVVDRPRHAFIPFSVGRRQCMAQEVSFMMLRVVLFEIFKHYRLRPAPGTAVVKNTLVTTKPAAVPVVRVPREQAARPAAAAAAGAPAPSAAGVPAPAMPSGPAAMTVAPAQAPAGGPAARPGPGNGGRPSSAGRDWGEPAEIPATSAYRHLVIAYGSNFGANKELAEQFAQRSRFYGYTSEVVTLNELAAAPPRTEPWLLAVLTSTYTSNPPSNAAAFKDLLERSFPGAPMWQQCRYLVWGLGNSQWNAFLAFPRWVHARLAELGATPVADFGYGDVGSPAWERLHAEWNNGVWPVLLELSGARRTDTAAARIAAEQAAVSALVGGESGVAMQRSLIGSIPAELRNRSAGGSSAIFRTPAGLRKMAAPAVPAGETAPPAPAVPAGQPVQAGQPALAGQAAPAGQAGQAAQPGNMLVPVTLTNAVDIETGEARVLAVRELRAAGSPKQCRHLELSLPAGLSYLAGGHVGICPKNDPQQVERLAARLGAPLDGIFMVPEEIDARAVPRGVVLQVRNVLTSLVDIAGRPSAALLDLLLEKVTDPSEWTRLAEFRDVLQWPDGPRTELHDKIDAGGYDVLQLLAEFPSCSLNIFDFLRVAQPLRPRYYSASSCPQVHGGQVVHLTVGHESVPVPGRPDRDFRGMSSHYMHTLREGDAVNVFFDDAAGFRLQDDPAKPMIFVSAGTGFAPMRAFLWQRQALRDSGAALGEAVLFNGIRERGVDDIYRDEIDQFTADGLLDEVHLVASREQPGTREHVQDRIRAQGVLMNGLLAEGGYVYVCGSQPMRDGVRAAFADVLTEHRPMPHPDAVAYLDALEADGHYRPDLWG
jgi:sulfite reductase alpha subunit-like flavoprotein/cytochrome P450/pSer/pThr/pTyr-binding forkhead associated (FHA) protein